MNWATRSVHLKKLPLMPGPGFVNMAMPSLTLIGMLPRHQPILCPEVSPAAAHRLTSINRPQQALLPKTLSKLTSVNLDKLSQNNQRERIQSEQG
jgi:hypothetical protein